MKTLIFGYVMKVRLLHQLLFGSLVAIFGCAPMPTERELSIEIPESSTYKEVLSQAQKLDPSVRMVRIEQRDDKKVVVIRAERNVKASESRSPKNQRTASRNNPSEDAIDFPSFSGVQFPNIFDIFRP